MIHSIKHQTFFDYETTPNSIVQRLHLTPLDNAHQRVMEWDIVVDGGAIELEAIDYHGNKVHLCGHHPATKRIEIICRGKVCVTDMNGISGTHDLSRPPDV